MFRNTEETIRCFGCGIEVTGGVWVVDHAIYCCQDCAQGLECHCGELLEQEDKPRGGGEALEAY